NAVEVGERAPHADDESENLGSSARASRGDGVDVAEIGVALLRLAIGGEDHDGDVSGVRLRPGLRVVDCALERGRRRPAGVRMVSADRLGERLRGPRQRRDLDLRLCVIVRVAGVLPASQTAAALADDSRKEAVALPRAIRVVLAGGRTTRALWGDCKVLN